LPDRLLTVMHFGWYVDEITVMIIIIAEFG
jgi:hypothetical protein